jgi:signal transduction histidine kinase
MFLLKLLEPSSGRWLCEVIRNLAELVETKLRANPIKALVLDPPILLQLKNSNRWLRLGYRYRRRMWDREDTDMLTIVVQDVTVERETTQRLQLGVRHLALSALYRAVIHEAQRPLVTVQNRARRVTHATSSIIEHANDWQRKQLTDALSALDSFASQCETTIQIIEKLRSISRTPDALELAPTPFWQTYVGCVARIEEHAKIQIRELVRRETDSSNGNSNASPFTGGNLYYPNKPVEGERYIMADRLVLETVLSIVLENAFVYGAARSSARSIHVAAVENPEQKLTTITVQDSGPGIPLEVIEHARELYSMAIKSHGLGVGIAIAKVLVEQMNGKFALSNNDVGGCCIFSLPTAFQPTLP